MSKIKETPNYYAILTADVRYDERLKPNEKLLFAEITALSNFNGFCNASNSYFASLYKVHKNTVGAWINRLVEFGYLKSELVYSSKKEIISRKLFIITSINKKVDTPINEIVDTYQQKGEDPINEIIEGNTTSDNNKHTPSSDDDSVSPPEEKEAEELKEEKFNALKELIKRGADKQHAKDLISNRKTRRLFAGNFPNILKAGSSVVLSGSVGTGKNHLSAAVANQLALGGYTSCLRTVSELIQSVRDGWNRANGKTSSQVIDEYVEFDLLIIDEFGVQSGTNNEINILFDIVNARYAEQKPTMALTNLTEDQFIKDRAINAIDPNSNMMIEIKKRTRTLDQNARLHAMLTDVSRQLAYKGKKRSVNYWKGIFVSGWEMATGKEPEIIEGLEGELINIRESTTTLSTAKLADLMTYIEAWSVGEGVKFTEGRWE